MPETPPPPSFGALIRGARRRNGWSQKDLADRVGVQADAVSDWENDRHEPRPAERRALERLLPELTSRSAEGPNERISGQERASLRPWTTEEQAKQQENAARAFQRALEAEELYGSALVRVLKSVADDLRRLGHRTASNEILAEVVAIYEYLYDRPAPDDLKPKEEGP
jgi:transcriptional regulator with XRE-family HTH domain